MQREMVLSPTLLSGSACSRSTGYGGRARPLETLPFCPNSTIAIRKKKLERKYRKYADGISLGLSNALQGSAKLISIIPKYIKTYQWYTIVTIILLSLLGFVLLQSFYNIPKGVLRSVEDSASEILMVPDQAGRTRLEPHKSCFSTYDAGESQTGCRTFMRPKREVVDISKLLPELAKSRFVYNRITTMWLDVAETVVFKLKLESGTPPQISSVMRGELASGLTPVTPEMSVELRGTAGFKIEPSGPIKQRISDVEASSWQWSVIPNKEGEGQLALTVFIHVDDKEPYILKTFEDRINVKVTGWKKVKDAVSDINPLWAFIVAVIPTVWAMYSWIRDRKWRSEEKQVRRAPRSNQRHSSRKRNQV
jgi:hypothetical protein